MAETTSHAPLCLARECELEQLAALLGEALAGRRSVCFVTGEAGAGKTTLLAEFCRQARARYPEVVIADGYCNAQTGMGDAYLPFREILAELAGEAPSSAASPGSPATETPRSARFFRAAARTLVEHGPDLIDIFVPGGALMTRLGTQAARSTRLGKRLQGGSDLPIAPGGIDQTHICEQYTNVLRQLARRQPLVVIVDDLHWADQASIELLFHLVRRLVEDPVLIVGAFRPEEMAAGRGRDRHPLEAAANEIKRYYGDVAVEIAATQGGGAAFIDGLLDAEPNALGRDFREALFRHTSGHALFTVELLQHLKQHGMLVHDSAGRWVVSDALCWEEVPARVEGVVEARLGRVEAFEREVLSVAAVAGDSFSAEALATVLDVPVREVVRTLSGPLSRQHRLVRPLEVQRVSGVRISAYEFRHSVFQKYIYSALDDIERVHLHEQLGLSLESLFARDPDGFALQLARHFAAAHEVEKAVRYLLAAARRAYASHAIDDATGHLRRALDLIGRDAGDEPPPDYLPDERREIHRLLAAVLERKCDYGEARVHVGKALELTGEDDRIGKATLTRALASTRERQSDYPEASRLFGEALDLLGEEPADAAADWWQEWVSIRLGQVWLAYWTRDVPGMQALIELLEPRIAEHGDALQRRRLWTSRTLLGFRQERFRLSEATVYASDQALAASKESDSLLDQAEAHFGAGLSRLSADQPGTAVDLFTQGLELAEKIGDVRLKGRTLTYLGIAYRRAGDPTAVERTLPAAQESATASGAQEYLGVVSANRSWLTWKAGDTSEAARLAEEAVAIWAKQAPNYPLQWLAKLQLIAIALDSGEVSVAVELGRGLLPAPNALLGEVTDALERAVTGFDSGDPEDAARALREAVSLAVDMGYL